jgi:queuine tRNA-ribosyltransferase
LVVIEKRELINITMFEITKEKYDARVGILQTRKGNINTPFFMPDATRASVRGLTNEQLKSVGVHPMVVNTYHLLLQPGMELMRDFGGAHKMMNWDGPLLSDSGGYQVYSLIHKNAKLGKITEEGAVFKSVLDGSKHLLTPEKAIQIQFDLGVDMMVLLDDPRPNSAPEDEINMAVERTIRWAKRCKVEFEKQISERKMDDNTRPLLFAVVQGGPFVHLREKCAKELVEIGFDGYSFGGRHVDENGDFMDEIVAKTAEFIPKESPRFALGIGTPQDIVKCHSLGWDMFDCVIPTREGRHGRIFVHNYVDIDESGEFYSTINIANAQFKNDFSPIDERCDCYACKNYTKAYLHHLFRVNEPLGAQMAALHNLKFFVQLMNKLQKFDK